MPRPVWRGHIAFGLVSIPVVLYPAEHRNELQFRLLDQRDHARVRYERVNAETGEEVPWDEIVRAFEYDQGNYVVLRDEDFQRAAPQSSHAVDITCFVPMAQICPKWFDKPYYLVPDRKGRGEKGYALLRDALRASRRVGIANVVIRTRAHLAALIPEGDALVLNLLRYHEELHRTEDLGLPADAFEAPAVNARERQMAEQLIASMSGHFKPEQWHDDYRAQLLAYIEQRQEKGQVETSPDADPPPRTGNVVDMTALLKRSLEQRGGKAATSKDAPDRPAPAKAAGKARTAPRKSAAKSAAKTPAKASPKTAARAPARRRAAS